MLDVLHTHLDPVATLGPSLQVAINLIGLHGRMAAMHIDYDCMLASNGDACLPCTCALMHAGCGPQSKYTTAPPATTCGSATNVNANNETSVHLAQA